MRTIIALTLGVTLLAAGAGVGALPLDTLDDNPWLDRGDLVIAHAGGLHESPGNTLFAFEEALRNGSDGFEVDLHRTLDGHVVALHDPTVDRTTDGTGPVQHMTLEEVKALDAAYWWIPDQGSDNHSAPEDAYVYRGVATGDVDPPAGYEPNDLRVPTLDELLQRVADVLADLGRSKTDIVMVLELKAASPTYQPFEHLVAERLVAHGFTGDNVMAGSFNDATLEAFKAHAAASGLHARTSVPLGQAAAFWASSQEEAPGTPNPQHDALQVPPVYNGIPVMSQDLVDDAHANGLAVHVWTINDEDAMHHYLDLGVEGILTDRPTLLQDVLEQRSS